MTRHRAKAAAGIQLFPFLAVLLCTMGALLLMLVVIARNSRDAAAKALLTTPQLTAKLAAEQAELTAQIAELKALREKLAAQFDDARDELSHVEDHLRRVRDEMNHLRQAAVDLRRSDQSDDETNSKLKKRIANYERDIKDLEEDLRKADEDARRKPDSFAIIPYDGPNQTRRRPIYIECRSDCVILQPEGIIFSEADFLGPMGPSNPLASALRAEREYLIRNRQAGRGDDGQPYPLLLVRPDGIPAYYLARGAMASWGSDFGYELVEADWNLAFPAPNPELAVTLAQTVEDARRRQVQIIASAPGLMTPDQRMAYQRAASGRGNVAGGGRSPFQIHGNNEHRRGSSGGHGPGAGKSYDQDQEVSTVAALSPYQSLDLNGSKTVAGTANGAGGTASTSGNVAGGGPGGVNTTGGNSINGNPNGVPSAIPGGPGTSAGGAGPGGTGANPGAFGPGGSGLASANPWGYGAGGPGGATPGGGPSLGNPGTGGNNLYAGGGNGAGGVGGVSMNGAQGMTGSPGINGAPGGDAAGGNGNGTGTAGGTDNSNTPGGTAGTPNGTGQGNSQVAGTTGAGPEGTGGPGGTSNTSGGSQQASTGSSGAGGGGAGATSSGNPGGGMGSAGLPMPVQMPGPGNVSFNNRSGAAPSGASSNSSASGSPSGASSNDPGVARAAQATRNGPRTQFETAGQRYGQQQPVSGDFASYSPSAASAGSPSAGTAGSPSASSSPSSSSQANLSKSQHQQLKKQARSRHDNWAIPQETVAAVPVSRPLTVECYADRLLFVSGRGEYPPSKTMTFHESTAESVEPMVAQVWERINSWGIAGDNMYWRPVLLMTVEPGGETRAAELQQLLVNSGLELKQRPPRVTRP
ncbi:MAG: hypothetical protein JSS27_07805 [Planctomycetes bacterium]|nr:hypothetical protein [Planctomycetota bacterium]